jgi:hypothetical protein
MAGVKARDAQIWIAAYERLLEPASLLVCSRSRKDRSLLRMHVRRLRNRLDYWKSFTN